MDINHLIISAVLLYFAWEGYMIGRQAYCDHFSSPFQEYFKRLILVVVCFPIIWWIGVMAFDGITWRQFLPVVWIVSIFEITMLVGLVVAVRRLKKI